jgi:hypothetical protein
MEQARMNIRQLLESRVRQHPDKAFLIFEDQMTSYADFDTTVPQPSTHIHSDYRRTLADLPWATTPVQLHLRVRRFWCETPHCARQTFTERVPQVAPCSARVTARLSTMQTSTGLALGEGCGGAVPGPSRATRQPQYPLAPGAASPRA